MALAILSVPSAMLTKVSASKEGLGSVLSSEGAWIAGVVSWGLGVELLSFSRGLVNIVGVCLSPIGFQCFLFVS